MESSKDFSSHMVPGKGKGGSEMTFSGIHRITYEEGRDPNSHTGRCSCGYAFSSTANEVKSRMRLHCERFVAETRCWNDPLRAASMPSFGRV